MAKPTFASMKLKIKDDVATFTVDDKVVSVKQYLPIEDKYDLVMIALQNSKEGLYYNQMKMDMFFSLYLVLLYTDIQFTDKQKEDLFKLYDILESNGIIAQTISCIPESEYNMLYEQLMQLSQDIMTSEQSFGGILNNFIYNLPENAQAAANIVDSFDPEKYGQVLDFAKAIGAKI